MIIIKYTMCLEKTKYSIYKTAKRRKSSGWSKNETEQGMR